MIVIPAIIEGVTTRRDKTLKITIELTNCPRIKRGQF